MAFTNKTTHYELPQYVANDKPTYLGDFNGAMSSIDTAIYNVDTKAESAIAGSQSASETATNAYTVATNASSSATTANENATNALGVANNATSTATSALSVANSVNDRVDVVDTNILNLKGKLLWKNLHPEQNFAEQDITLSSSDFDFYEIYFETLHSSGDVITTKSIKGNGARLFTFNGIGYLRVRYASFTNDTTLHFTKGGFCQQVNPANGFPIVNDDNDSCIPLYVIGYKNNILD